MLSDGGRLAFEASPAVAVHVLLSDATVVNPCSTLLSIRANGERHTALRRLYRFGRSADNSAGEPHKCFRALAERHHFL